MVLGGIGGPELGRLDYTDGGHRGGQRRTAGRHGLAAQRILISDRLRQRVRLDFECRPVGERTLPGLREPMAVHDVVSRRTGFLSSSSRAPASSGNSDQETPQLGAALSARSAW